MTDPEQELTSPFVKEDYDKRPEGKKARGNESGKKNTTETDTDSKPESDKSDKNQDKKEDADPQEENADPQEENLGTGGPGTGGPGGTGGTGGPGTGGTGGPGTGGPGTGGPGGAGGPGGPGTGGPGGPGGPGGAGGTGGTGGTGGGTGGTPTGPPTPRSAKFNIYDTDQLDAGGVPFSEVFLEGFKFLGDNFAKTARTFTNAVLNVFSKPISSMRVLGEAAIKYGQGASARIEQAYQKHGNAPWVQKTEAEDLAAAQQAIMNSFIYDISEVQQMNLDALMDRMSTLKRLRYTNVDLNGTTFYGIDSDGNIISPGSLGLQDLVSYVNGDPTCGGKYEGGLIASDDSGSTYHSVTDRQYHQLRHYANEYNAINDALRTELQIRKYDLYSERKADEYNEEATATYHKLWITDPNHGIDHIPLTSQSGTTYQSTPAQALAREYKILGEDGLLNKELLMATNQTEARNKAMNAATAKIYTDTSLTDEEVTQLRALYQICEVANWVTKQKTSQSKKLIPEKEKEINDALENYLADKNTHLSLGAMGVDVSDPTSSTPYLFNYDTDLPEDRHCRKKLWEAAKFNPGVPIYNKETMAAIESSVGATIAMDKGLTFAVFELGLTNRTTREDLETQLQKLIQDKNFHPEEISNRAMFAAGNMLKQLFTANAALTPILKELGFGSDSEAGQELETLMSDPIAFTAINPDELFGLSYSDMDPTNINACSKYERALMSNLVVPKGYITNVNLQNFVSPTTGMPYDPDHTTFMQLIEDYKEAASDPATYGLLKDLLHNTICTCSKHVYAKMDKKMGYVKNALVTAQAQLKSPLAVMRVTEMLAAMNLLGGTSAKPEVITKAYQALMTYFETPDSKTGDHLSPGCTAIDPRRINGKEYQEVNDPVKHNTKLLPVEASLGDDDLFKQSIQVLKDALADADGGRLMDDPEAKRRMARLDRLLAPEDRVHRSCRVASAVRKFSNWDPLYERDEESRAAFKEKCTKSKLLEIDTQMRARLNENTASPDVGPMFRDRMNNYTSYLVTSTAGVLNQFDQALKNDSEIGSEFLSQTVSDIIERASPGIKSRLERILSNVPYAQYDPDEMATTVIKYLQNANSLDITDRGRAEDMFGNLIGDYQALDYLFNSMNFRIEEALASHKMNPNGKGFPSRRKEYPLYDHMAFSSKLF